MEIYSPSHLDIGKGSKVCGIDLDDVLSDSIPQWLKFCKDFLCRPDESLPEKSISEIMSSEWYVRNIVDSSNWTENFDNLHSMKKFVPYYYYRILKEIYRNSPVKRNLPMMEDANKFIFGLLVMNYKVIIITAREERFLKITVDWLKENKIQYDGIIFNKDKHVKIVEKYPSMEFMVEDNRDVANLVAKWGYRVFLFNNKYNIGRINNSVKRVDSFSEILEYLNNKGFGDER